MEVSGSIQTYKAQCRALLGTLHQQAIKIRNQPLKSPIDQLFLDKYDVVAPLREHNITWVRKTGEIEKLYAYLSGLQNLAKDAYLEHKSESEIRRRNARFIEASKAPDVPLFLAPQQMNGVDVSQPGRYLVTMIQTTESYVENAYFAQLSKAQREIQERAAKTLSIARDAMEQAIARRERYLAQPQTRALMPAHHFYLQLKMLQETASRRAEEVRQSTDASADPEWLKVEKVVNGWMEELKATAGALSTENGHTESGEAMQKRILWLSMWMQERPITHNPLPQEWQQLRAERPDDNLKREAFDLHVQTLEQLGRETHQTAMEHRTLLHDQQKQLEAAQSRLERSQLGLLYRQEMTVLRQTRIEQPSHIRRFARSPVIQKAVWHSIGQLRRALYTKINDAIPGLIDALNHRQIDNPRYIQLIQDIHTLDELTQHCQAEASTTLTKESHTHLKQIFARYSVHLPEISPKSWGVPDSEYRRYTVDPAQEIFIGKFKGELPPEESENREHSDTKERHPGKK